jgi:hypothetical protein
MADSGLKQTDAVYVAIIALLTSFEFRRYTLEISRAYSRGPCGGALRPFRN